MPWSYPQLQRVAQPFQYDKGLGALVRRRLNINNAHNGVYPRIKQVVGRVLAGRELKDSQWVAGLPVRMSHTMSLWKSVGVYRP